MKSFIILISLLGFFSSLTYAQSSLNTTSSVAQPDIYLFANVSVGEIDIEVDNIQAHLNLNAVVANSLVTITAGVDVSIEKVQVTIKQIEANVLLTVYLDNVEKIVSRTLETIDRNPQILTSLIQTIGETLTNVLTTTVNALGQTVNTLIDATGQIVEKVLDPVTSKVLNSTVVGNVLNLPVLSQKAPGADGSVEKLVYDATSKSLITVLVSSTGQLLDSQIVQQNVGL